MIFSKQITPEFLALGVIGAIVFVALMTTVVSLIIKRPKTKKMQKRWKAIQSKLSMQNKWREALLEADALLDQALKKNNFTGKTIGEKLVKAEKRFSEKDEVWFAHRLSKLVVEKPDYELKKDDMKRALLGIRRGIKDLGVL